MRKLKVAIAGATGAVGREMIKVLEERDFPVGELKLLASERSEGQKVEFRGEEITVRRLTPESFAGVEIALFSPGGAVSREFAPHAARAGAVVIDNSSAFRMEADCPLVVPEVNPGDLLLAVKPGGRRIVANPNCSTIQLVVVLKPLHDAATLTRVIVSTYQSVSGAGQKGIDELESQSRALFALGEITPSKFAHRIAFNLLPEIGPAMANGYTEEEMKMVNETRKILGVPDLPVAATCVRVPIFYCHSEAANLTFKDPLSPERARELLKAAPGVKVVDDLAQHIYPMPMLAVGDNDTHVGRIRADISQPNSLALFVVSDNLRKGAATNAVQIAEALLQNHAAALGMH
jgi:aspartate-semialdehyde dehydrogenase